MATAEDKAGWLRRVLGIELRPPAAAQSSPRPAAASGAGKGMAAWQAARGAALESLKALEKAFRTMEDPEVDAAIIMLRAVQANLTAAPETPRQVAELEAYISSDAVVEEAQEPNGFGIAVDLKAPLLAALAVLRAEHAETVGAPP